MPRRSVQLPTHALLSRQEWLGLGMSARRLSGPELVSILPGYLTPTVAPAPLEALCSRLQKTVLPGAVISDATAAALFGWPLPWWWESGIGLLAEQSVRVGGSYRTPSRLRTPESAMSGEPHSPGRPELNTVGRSPAATGRALNAVGRPSSSAKHALIGVDGPVAPDIWLPPPLHCTVPQGAARSAGPFVTVHRRVSGTAIRWDGLIVSHPIEVLCQIAGSLPLDEVVVILDHLLGPNSRITGWSRELITEHLAIRDNRRGVSTVLRALALARPRVESPGETRLRLLVVRAGFPEPAINLAVPDPDRPGRFRRLDLGWEALKLGVEYQGDHHRAKRNQWREDLQRRDSLASVGWDLREVTAADIAAPERFLNSLRRSFLVAGADAPPASNWLGAAGRALGRRSAPPELR